jgi:PPOX class probable F420-dependent enzyme
MAVLSDQEIEAYLAEPHVAQLVTVRPDGRPHMAPVWFMTEGRRALVMAGANAVKVRNIRRNPAVALSIATDQRPYKYVVLEGEGLVTDRDLPQVVQRICARYDGPEQGPVYAGELLSGGQTLLVDIRVTRVTGWKDD